MQLQISGLTKRYGRLTALDDVSFSIRPGEVLGLIGVSFITAVRTYAELSGLNGTAAGVGEAFSPLIGIWAPTFSACELAAAFLLPFVGIRLVGGDRQDGTLKLEYTLGSQPGPGRNNAPPHPDLFPANNPVLRPPVAGRIGLWTKTDSTSYFKDYVVMAK